jgi:pentatricopeptide repeat protein
MIRSHYHVRQCVLRGRSPLTLSNLYVSKFGSASGISQRYSFALTAPTTDKEIVERVIRRDDAQLRGERLPSPGEVLAKKPKWVAPAPGSKRFLEANGLEDPLKLAEYVLAQLRKGRVGDAEMVVKNASSLGQYTVSWNHLIKWYASEGKLKMALGLYNDVGISSFLNEHQINL